jgi:hypothetical protein
MNLDFTNINPDLSSSNDIIRQLEPTVIPRVSAIARIALRERAAYHISFFGMESNDYSADGEIGNAVHRIKISIRDNWPIKSRTDHTKRAWHWNF